MSIIDTINAPGSTFRWLHLSDIHVGVGGQDELWPRFKTNLLDDIDRTLKRDGAIDLIIFSGDLAQRGAAEEFARFDMIMDEILDRIAQRQARPMVITVPGNHDLVRPAALSPEAMALKQFWNNSSLRDGFWVEDGKDYRSFIGRVFQNYTDWQARAIERGVHASPVATGPLPGDAAYQLETPAGRLGVAALNSTWLQLSGSKYEGELHVDARQLLAITGAQPDDWVRANDASLLVTHHPASWLHAHNPTTWENDINPTGRFDLHLFGHMHQPDTATIAHGGGLGRRDVQAASLFGLETYGDGTQERIQGYSASSIRVDGCYRRLTSWPRRLVKMAGGKMKLVPDSEQDIDEATGSFSIAYQVERRAAQTGTIVPPPVPSDLPVELVAPSGFALDAIQHMVGEAKAHQRVRRVEQQTCVAALAEKRIVWLSADWGMGKDGFIASVRGQLNVTDDRIYSIDFSGYKQREPFFDSLRTRFGVSFQQICEAIADAGPAILVLDDIDVAAASTGETSLEADIEALARTVADFASDAFVFIRSRRRPRFASYQIIELGALDEADVATYAGDSEIGGERYAKPDAASTLFRHTDGVPTRIDAALRDLEIISLRDLISSNPDFGDTGGTAVAAPTALVTTIQELQQSEDRAEQRAYDLLLALAALPQGEQLSRLKRFLGVHPLGPMHARALLERSLIDTVNIASLEMVGDATDKALVVPRPVRDYVRDTIDLQLAKSTDLKVLDLYFGENWASGNIRNSPTCKRVREALCDGYEIQNAGTLIPRTARRALEGGIRHEIDGTIRLASAFVEVLILGAHFRSAASLCEDMLQLLEGYDGFEKELTVLGYEYARSLRMTGHVQKARGAFEALDHGLLSKQQRQHAELGLAMCLDRQGETAAAAEVAKRTIALDKSSNAALQAKVIIAEQIPGSVERGAELQRLLQVAQRKEAHTVANNIMLVLARDARSRGDTSNDLLKQVILKSGTNGDFYNAARAIVDLAGQPGAENRMTKDERDRLIEAYHFLYNERLFDLFDRCHAALWRVFERDGDRANLLNLFRRSSFIWRLNGREAQEITYLSKLTKNVHDLIAAGLTQANRDGAYFVVRVTVVMGAALPGLAVAEAEGGTVLPERSWADT